MKWILASQSPRRKALFSLISPEFEVRPSAFNENSVTADTPKELTMLLAQKKAESVPHAADEAVVGCDTVVALENEVLGKPENRADARRMHYGAFGKNACGLHWGLCAVWRETACFCRTHGCHVFCLSEEEIESYLDTEEPYDKAGAYGIQGRAALFVERITGDYNNVVGLPAARLARTLCGEWPQRTANTEKSGEKR